MLSGILEAAIGRWLERGGGGGCRLCTKRPTAPVVASESPHDSCLKLAPRVFAPAGQKLRFWPNCLTPSAVFILLGQKLSLLANRPYGRRSLSGCTRQRAVRVVGQREGAAPQGLTGRVVPVSHRTSYIVHRKCLRSPALPPQGGRLRG